MHPLKLGSADLFATLRKLLLDSGYTESAVCDRLQIASIYDFRTLREGRQGSPELNDKLDLLIRLFMDQQAVNRDLLHSHLGPHAEPVMRELALLKDFSTDPSKVYADAVLYPQEGLFVASDRTFHVDPGAGSRLPDDVVYASITHNTGRFVSILPEERCEKFLELCSGTGIAALIAAARYANESWACDLSSRCTHFAEFNARLNGITNLHALTGDLYAPVEGRRFDRIVAHPPYIPAEAQKLMFRDGGEDGEQILRGILEGLPRFLEPGGRFYALTLVTDREQETIEQRVRKWLGPAQNEFDVFLVFNDAERRPDTILKAVAEAKGKYGQLGPRSALYEKLKVETILYGVVLVERHTAERAVITARAKKHRKGGTESVEWFRRWRKANLAPEFPRQLPGWQPRIAPGFMLQVTHLPREGRLDPVEFRARVEHPLESDARLEPWVVVLLEACDGSRTVDELFGYLQNQEAITAGMPREDFFGVVRLLVESGFLEVKDFAHPNPRSPLRVGSATAVQQTERANASSELQPDLR